MSYELESLVFELQKDGVAVDLLVDTSNNSDTVQVGVRLRPFGKLWPKRVMVIASGDNFVEALKNAIAKANRPRAFEDLDYAARPWATYAAAGRLIAVPPENV
jgi:hypothetical protein